MTWETYLLYIVVPCYNEEVLPETARQLKEKMETSIAAGRISEGGAEVLFVNDGSPDKTWSMIEGLHRADRRSPA